jgi:putative membrane protein
MALRATILATVALSAAFAWTAGALAYDTGGTASTAAVGASAVEDTVPASAGRGSGTGVDAAMDMFPPDGATELAPPQMMDGDNDWDSGWWIVMAVMMMLFWGAIIAVAVWGIRQFTRDRRPGRSALDIAKERLAMGEITKEEFDRIRGDLT